VVPTGVAMLKGMTPGEAKSKKSSRKWKTMFIHTKTQKFQRTTRSFKHKMFSNILHFD
jgi:hypothetical protein